MGTRKLDLAKFSIIAIAVAILGGSLIYAKGWHNFLFPKKLTPAAGAELIPDEAVVTSFISTDTNNWEKLEQLGLPELEVLFPEPFQSIEQEFTELEITYEQDIQPWIGDSILALIPKTANSDESEDFDTLGIIGINDPLEANNFLKKIQPKLDSELEKTKYKGIEITTSTDDEGKILHTALLGSNLALSENIDVVQKSIDSYKGGNSLINSPKTKEIFQQKIDLDNSLAQVYFTNYSQIIDTGLQDSDISENTKERLKKLQSFSLGFSTEENKIKVKSLAKLAPKTISTEYKNTPGKVLDILPEDTIAFVSSQGINDVWRELSEISFQEPELQNILDGLRQSTKFVTGLDLDQDIFSWMDGEFALGIIPSSQPNIPGLNRGISGTLVLETSDRTTAQNTINTVDNKFQQNFGFFSQKLNNKDKDITQWPIPDTDLVFSVGWIKKNNLLVAFGNSDSKSLYKSNQSSLKNSYKFQEIADNLPNKNFGYFYVDMDVIMAEITPLLLGENPELNDVVSTLNSITAIGGTTTILDQETSKTEMIILVR